MQHTRTAVTYLLTGLVLLAHASGCHWFSTDGLENISQVPLEFTVPDLHVDEQDPAFNKESKFDLNTNSTFADNKSHLSHVNVSKVWIKLLSQPTNAATVLLSGEASISKLNNIEKTTLQLFSNTTIASLEGVETELVLTPAGKTKLEEILSSDPHSGIIGFEGTTDIGPVKFMAQFRLELSLVVSL